MGRRHGRGLKPAHPCVAAGGRDPQPAGEPSCPLRGRERLSPQGGHSCLGGPERPAHLRARGAVGNVRKVLVSDQGGQSNAPPSLSACRGLEEHPRSAACRRGQRFEAQGFAFEGADVLLRAGQADAGRGASFDVERFSNVERRFNAVGEMVTASEARRCGWAARC